MSVFLNRSLALLFLFAWLCIGTTEVHAVSGNEYQARQADLVVSVDSRWPGCMSGGYHPIRIRIQNRAEARNVRVDFQPYDSGLPAVSRTVNCAQNATSFFTLLVPMVGAGSGGNLLFSSAEGRLKDLEHSISLAEPDYSDGQPSLLVISPKFVDCTQFELAISSMFGMTRGRFGSTAHEDHVVVTPDMLPNTTLAYSGIDMIAVPFSVLTLLPNEIRESLLSWTQMGGTLIVTEAGDAGYENVELLKLVGLDRTSQRDDWKKSNQAVRSSIIVRTFDSNGNMTSQTDAESDKPIYSWGESDRLFAHRKLGLGQVVVHTVNPFPGSPKEWSWLLQSLSNSTVVRWSTRHGTNSRGSINDFDTFYIPGIETVPVNSFLFLITGFAVLIGPLNYYYLVKRNRLNALVVTVPVLAFLTSISLFAFAAMSHGFGIKAKLRSLTIIDQGLQTATVSGRISLYGGMSPSGGLKFSPDTMVSPLWPQSNAFESGSLDWTQTQHFTNGWLRARTKTQFYTLVNRLERGRLKIDGPQNGTYSVSNGFEWNLEHLIVSDDNGELYYGENIAAGSTKKLLRSTKSQEGEIVQNLVSAAPKLPTEYSTGDFGMFSDFRNPRRYSHHHYNEAAFYHNNGQMEKTLTSLQTWLHQRNTENKFPNRMYFATIKANPKLETGTDVNVIDQWHAVIGYY